jgi:Zn-dependent M16 (insulinase) family peptidase
MYKALINTHIGSVLFMSGFEENSFNSTFHIGVDGISEENAERFEQIVLETLAAVVQDGFDQERIDSVLRRLELALLCKLSDEGRVLISTAAYSWLAGANPADVIDSHAGLLRIRAKLGSSPRMFEELIEKYLLGNPHRLRYTARPQQGLLDELNARVARELAERKQGMSDEEKAEVNRKVLANREYADQPQPLHLLPEMKRADLDPIVKLHLPDFESDGLTVFRQPVAGLTHIHVEILVSMSHPLITLLPLTCQLLTKLGAG